MWKPLDVVPEHRAQATVVWGALLIAIVAYTVLQITALHSKFENPSTNFSVSEELYEFPPLEICLWHGMGCDSVSSMEECVESVSATAYGSDNREMINNQFDSQWSNCVGVDLGHFGIKDFENQDNSTSRVVKPTVTVTASWDISSSIQEPYREVVGFFLGNDSAAELINVPYSRVVHTPDSVPGPATFIETYMTIGKHTRKSISGDSVVNYPVLTLSSGNFVYPTVLSTIPDDDNSVSARGYLHITLTQGLYSVTELSDISPLDISTILGNIGGFWEILLVTWAIFFISSNRESPKQRARDFTEAIERAKEIVSLRRRFITQAVAPDAKGGDGGQPCKTAESKGLQDFPGVTSIRVIPPVGAPAPLKRANSYSRRPIQNDYPVRPAASVTCSVDDGDGSVGSDGST